MICWYFVLSYKICIINLTNLVNCSTNFTTTEGPCIDLLITSDPSLVDSTFVTPFCSTHSVVGLDLTCNIHKHYAYKRETTLYNEANYTHLNSELDKINWDNEVFSTTHMDELYSKFMDVLTTAINKHIPKKLSQYDQGIKYLWIGQLEY